MQHAGEAAARHHPQQPAMAPGPRPSPSCRCRTVWKPRPSPIASPARWPKWAAAPPCWTSMPANRAPNGSTASKRRMTSCSIAATRPTAPGRINACARPTASSCWRAPTSRCRCSPLDLPAFKERASGLPELLLLHPPGDSAGPAGAFLAAHRPVRIPSPYPRRQHRRYPAAGALHRRPRRGPGAGGRRRARLRPYRHHQGADGSRACRSIIWAAPRWARSSPPAWRRNGAWRN